MSLHTHTPHPHIARRQTQGPHLVDDEHVGINGRIAAGITRLFGSMGMLYLLIGWMVCWIALATLGVWLFRHDQYPFAFLLFCSNLIQLWALPVLAVGQQVLSRASDKRAIQTYQDVEAILHEVQAIQAHLVATTPAEKETAPL